MNPHEEMPSLGPQPSASTYSAIPTRDRTPLPGQGIIEASVGAVNANASEPRSHSSGRRGGRAAAAAAACGGFRRASRDLAPAHSDAAVGSEEATSDKIATDGSRMPTGVSAIAAAAADARGRLVRCLSAATPAALSYACRRRTQRLVGGRRCEAPPSSPGHPWLPRS